MAIAAALLMSTSVGQAQFTIKLKERGEGESAVIQQDKTSSTKVKVTDAAGNVLADKSGASRDVKEFKETILARQPGKQPTNLTRQYLKAQTVVDEKVTDGPLHGKTVNIVKKGKMYEFTYADGDKVEGAAAAALIEEFSKKSDAPGEIEKMVLPPTAVKAGESWKIDMAKIVAEFTKDGNLKLDADKATGQGTLVKAYKKGKTQFGELKWTMEMPLLATGQGKKQLTFKAGAKMVIELHLDACIDGTSEAGTLKMKMNLAGTGMASGNTVVMSASVDGTQVQHDGAKK
jgi:hypothetical protein